MRAPDGTVISGFELHDAEKLSLIKYDALSVEGMDKIQICLELLIENGFVKPEATLKETYEKVIGIYNIERDDPKMWEKVWKHEIISLFQMEQQSGIQGIAATKPNNVDDLASLNSVIRLMAQEKGAETPIEKYARFRRNPQAWETEMKLAGLNATERELLHRELDVSSGLCIAQEQFMMLVQLPEIGGFDLQWADRLRKSIAKKNPKEYDKLTKEFYDNMHEKNLSENLCAYVWDTLIAMNRGYGFNAAHTLGYSLVALQEMNLAHNFPIIFWNTANLIVDSAGVAETEEDDEETLVVELEDSEEVEEIVDIYEPEEWEEYEYEDLPDRSAKKKKKTKSINFGKIATAIGKFQMAGIKVTPPNINESGFTFTPLVKENAIASGLRNITRISADLVNQIIANRPYTSIDDFQEKVKVNRTQMLMLLKCGAFDSLEPDRMAAIQKYLSTKAATKEKLTLANVPMLIKYGIFDEDAAEYCELYSFNKFLKKHVDGDVIVFPNEKAMEYYCDHFDVDLLLDGYSIGVKTWEKIYKKGIAPLGEFIKDNMEDLLDRLNTALIEEQFENYAKGTISHYEIESMSFYYHDHELKNVNRMIYDIKDFNKLPEKPIVARKIPTKDGKEIELLELAHICGTVLDKNKMKNSISLLTPTGVVTVKIWKNQFAKYDKQISEIQSDGKKKVREKSWFSRGNLLYLQGVRRGDAFIPKAYKGSTHRIPIMKITSVEGDKIIFTDKRYDEE